MSTSVQVPRRPSSLTDGHPSTLRRVGGLTADIGKEIGGGDQEDARRVAAIQRTIFAPGPSIATRNGFNGVVLPLTQPSIGRHVSNVAEQTHCIRLLRMECRQGGPPIGQRRGRLFPTDLYRSPYNLPHVARRMEDIQKVNF